MGLLPPVISVLEADVSGFVGKMQLAKGEMDAVDKKGEAVSGRFRTGIATGLMGAGLAFAGAGTALVGVSDKIEKAEATLKTVIDNTGKSYEDYKGKIDKAIDSEARFGHGSADTQEALAKLTGAYQDPNKALAQLSLTSDIAAMKHISLADAAGIVVRMHGGAAKSFKEFGINVHDNSVLLADAAKATKAHEGALATLAKAQQALSDLEARDAGKKKLTIADQQALTKAHEAVSLATAKVGTTAGEAAAAQDKAKNATKDYEALMGKLHDRIKGVAEAQHNTFGGKFDEIKTRIENFAGTIGKTLGPMLITLGPLLMGVGSIMQFAVAPGFLAAAGGVLAFAWPILAVVAVIAGLVLAFKLAYDHIKPFHELVDKVAAVLKVALAGAMEWAGKTFREVWPAISKALGQAWEFMKPILDILLDILVVQIRVAIWALKGVWDLAWAAIHAAIKFYGPPIMAIFDVLKKALGAVGDALGVLKKDVWDPLWNGISKTVTEIWKVLSPIFDAISKGVGAIGGAVSTAAKASGIFKDLPHFAEGGWVPGSGPQLSVVHGGEFVATPAMMARGGGGNIGSVTININGSNKDPQQIAREVREELLRMQRSLPTLGFK